MIYQPFLICACAVLQAACSTVFSCLLAAPLAYFLYRYECKGKQLFLVLSTMLCVMPTKMVVACMSVSYGITGFTGIVIGHVLLNMPFAVYQFYLGLRTLDDALELSAVSLGASQFYYMRTVVLPLLLPTILQTAALIFFLCFTSVSIPFLLGSSLYHATPDMVVYKNVCSQHETFLYMVLRLCIAVPLVLGQLKKHAVPPDISRVENKTVLSKNIFLVMYCLLAFFLLLFPFVSFLLQAVNGNILIYYKSIVHGALEPLCGHFSIRQVIANSLLLAFVSACGAVLVGFLLSMLEQSLTSCYARSAVVVIAHAPLMLGGTIIALGTHGSGILSAICCHVLLNYPFTYCVLKSQASLCTRELYFLAQSLGASRMKFYTSVIFPLMRAACAKAFCIAFGLSLTEAVGVHGNFYTIARAVHLYRAAGKAEEMIGISLILLLLVLFVTAGVQGTGWVQNGWRRAVARVNVKFARKCLKDEHDFFVAGDAQTTISELYSWFSKKLTKKKG